MSLDPNAPRPTDLPSRPTVLVIAGTRPEAIKLAPVIARFRSDRRVRPITVATGQHPTMVADALGHFALRPDVVLELGDRPGGSQAALFEQLVPRLDATFGHHRPAAVVVQGDTASAFAGALAGIWHQVPVVHVEAGLRSHDLANPFPEEAYRRLIGSVAALHLPPTPGAAANLRREGVADERVLVTGNTVIDAAQLVAASSAIATPPTSLPFGRRRTVLVTVHRRESWGEPLLAILRAVRRIVEVSPDIDVLLPAHPNPLVRDPITEVLGDVDRVRVTDPLPYPALITAIERATLVLTDSGGIQEEAPGFGTPVLVLRTTTERPEAVDAGCAELVGTDPSLIVERTLHLLRDERARTAMAQVANPFGDGAAARRVVGATCALLGLGLRPEPWSPATATGPSEPHSIPGRALHPSTSAPLRTPRGPITPFSPTNPTGRALTPSPS